MSRPALPFFVFLAVCTCARAPEAAGDMVADLRLSGQSESSVLITHLGQIVSMDLYIHVTGENADATDDALWKVYASFVSANVNRGSVLGTLTAEYLSPFNSMVSQDTRNGRAYSQDLDGDGDLDVGSNNINDANGWFLARAGGYVPGSGAAPAEFHVATLTFTVTGYLSPEEDAVTEITTLPRSRQYGSRQYGDDSLWQEDGEWQNGSLTMGDPVSLLLDEALRATLPPLPPLPPPPPPPEPEPPPPEPVVPPAPPEPEPAPEPAPPPEPVVPPAPPEPEAAPEPAPPPEPVAPPAPPEPEPAPEPAPPPEPVVPPAPPEPEPVPQPAPPPEPAVPPAPEPEPAPPPEPEPPPPEPVPVPESPPPIPDPLPGPEPQPEPPAPPDPEPVPEPAPPPEPVAPPEPVVPPVPPEPEPAPEPAPPPEPVVPPAPPQPEPVPEPAPPPEPVVPPSPPSTGGNVTNGGQGGGTDGGGYSAGASDGTDGGGSASGASDEWNSNGSAGGASGGTGGGTGSADEYGIADYWGPGDQTLRLSWAVFARDVLSGSTDLRPYGTIEFFDMPPVEEVFSLYEPYTAGPWTFWFGDGSEWSGGEVVLVRDGTLWTPAPTPEPASLAFLAAGVAAMLTLRKRS